MLPGIPIQVEEHRAEFRFRSRGRVLRAAWIPPSDAEPAPPAVASELRARFLAECADGFSEAAGQGAGAVIVGKLRG